MAVALSIFFFSCFDGENGIYVTLNGTGFVQVSGENTDSPDESIYVRKVGNGPKTIVLLSGNNTSGASYEVMLNWYRSIEELNSQYTVYTFDYRGSGYSSYNADITGLKTFAVDFEKVMSTIKDFPTSDVTLVGYSMGAGVAYNMVNINPARYSNVITLAGISTRGTRIGFSASTAGTDPATGITWNPGDMFPVADEAVGLAAATFNQRTWQGEARTWENVTFIWDLLVFNDILKYDIFTYAIGDPTFKNTKAYENTIEDIFTIQYMPESMYYCHKLNVSPVDVTAGTNSITFPGDGSLADNFTGINVMLVKAATSDIMTTGLWSGDQIVFDIETKNTKYDLKQAGANVTAVMIGYNQGYDHGFPIAKSLQVVKLIDQFLGGTLSATTAVDALGVSDLTIYENAETTWEQALSIY